MSSPFLRRVSLSQPGAEVAYPFNLPLFANGFQLDFNQPCTIIAGDNGSGKSTLLEAIAGHCGFSQIGGNRNQTMQAPESSRLVDAMKFSWLPKVTRGFFFRAESFFNYASYIEDLSTSAGAIAFAPYGGKSLHQQSHGEAFLSLFKNRFGGGKGIYILDEPEAALSPLRQLTLLAIMKDLLESGNVQIIMATHSPILMSYPGAQFLYLQNGILNAVNPADTEHYQITRRFLQNPQTYLNEIFGK